MCRTIGKALAHANRDNAHETLRWASKRRGFRHTFNYDLINSRDPKAQVSTVWSIPSVPEKEKLHADLGAHRLGWVELLPRQMGHHPSFPEVAEVRG
jgi:hypothetical protein